MINISSRSKSQNRNFLLIGLLVAGVAVTVYATTSFKTFNSDAASVKNVSGSSIDIVETAPKLGDYVHFTYVLPKGVKEQATGSGTQARIQVMCYQNGEIVYGMADNAINVKIGAAGMLLGGGASLWLQRGGAADCVATLYQWTYQGSQQFVPFATTSFPALGK